VRGDVIASWWWGMRFGEARVRCVRGGLALNPRTVAQLLYYRSAMSPRIVVAGVTANLGLRIARALLQQGATVVGLVRTDTPAAKRAEFTSLGIEVVGVDYATVSTLADACTGAACVVSSLAGLRPVILDAQTALLDGAVKAGVPRFIPSDYSTDFTKLSPGTNRNLDLRREFHAVLATRPIAATSVFNGAFADMLTGQAPFILFKRQRVLCWGSADQRMSFTTIDDTATFTASAALDDKAPRYLRISGDRISARELAGVMREITGTPFKLFHPGPVSLLGVVIKVARALTPTTDALYPPWQGMQYMHNMFEGKALPEHLDNDRYGVRRWTTAKDVLTAHHAATAQR
jgi:nucleoside-diphosphate-sugar epimerase